MTTLKNLELEIEGIKERNKRVETEKAWETSWTRKLMVAVLTYIVVVTLFTFVGSPNPMESAVVPTIAFLLSTMSAPFIKRFWLKYINNSF